ncbi:MAG: peptidoglycan-binding protein [Holosporales bacterium]|jgi:chemotaxis protein MotB|nr:peptidoglycan-binding protein [Holosporales bacterium]
MAFNRIRNRSSSTVDTNSVDIWPGFVDALSTVLLVFIFVLVGFISSQVYLSGLIVDKDTSLNDLQIQVQNLCSLLNQEKNRVQETETINSDLIKEMAQLKETLMNFENEFEIEKENHEKTLDDKKTLEEELDELNKKMKKISDSLDSEKSKTEKLSKNLNAIKKMSDYTSEFFDKLQNIVKDKDGVKIVGDRFIFQSELFFDTASDVLNEEGKIQISNLAKIINDIGSKIPSNIKWILRVDGHTDSRPISSKFPSNWELSSARAISVVKSLIDHGVDPEHLVAAGFGEFQPITDDEDEESLAKNRRIEFKLDQR